MELKVIRKEGKVGGSMSVVIDSTIIVSDLQGSEKQVAWANTIRHNWFNLFLGNSILACGLDNAQANFDKAVEVNPVVISRINQTSAKWWIDNKDNPKAQ